MAELVLEGLILTEAGWVPGRLGTSATIQRIESRSDARTERRILPGFIDLHVHGGGGADCMDGEDSLRQMARFHARHGTTSLLATTVTAPLGDLRVAFGGIGAVAASPAPGEARVLGAHLEGPFLNPEALGAQPPFAIRPDLALVEELSALAPIKVATIAPEIDPDGILLANLVRRGVRVQIGHTTCDFAEAEAALARGASGFTHLFNAMSGFHHRRAGAAGCALANGAWAELILDLLHVEAGALRVALRAIPGAYGITDAVAAAGMPDGEYALGRHRIHKSGDSVRLEGGGLAGSVLTMDQAFRNLLGLSLEFDEASRRLSALPASYLGLADRGRIAQGASADLIVMDDAGRLEAVFVEGRKVG